MKKKISGGIYVVIDPSMEENLLLEKLEEVLQFPIAAVQIWNNFPPSANRKQLTSKVCQACHKAGVPVLVNNDLELLNSTAADGIHFDVIPPNFSSEIKDLTTAGIIGITCNNDLTVVEWAEQNNLDYISFCSVFPSSTSNSCDLVSFDNIRRAKEMTQLPVFLAGGINPGNMEKLAGLNFDGVAVISGIMGAEKPALATKEYQNLFERIKNEKRNH